jgi:hypothetical protein
VIVVGEVACSVQQLGRFLPAKPKAAAGAGQKPAGPQLALLDFKEETKAKPVDQLLEFEVATSVPSKDKSELLVCCR